MNSAIRWTSLVLMSLVLASGAAAQDGDRAQDRGSAEASEGLGHAATAPLRDLNVERADIPDVLRRAMSDPYSLKGLRRCEAIANEVGRLDAALGPDLDEQPPPDHRSRRQRLGSALHGAATSAVKGKAEGLLPFRTWIRKLSGAERHDRAMQQAIRSGGIRRGYLKGVGMRMNCAPPAAPSWFEPHRDSSSPFGWFERLWSRLAQWLRQWWPF